VKKCTFCQKRFECEKLKNLGYLGSEDNYCLSDKGWGFGANKDAETSKKEETVTEKAAA